MHTIKFYNMTYLFFIFILSIIQPTAVMAIYLFMYLKGKSNDSLALFPVSHTFPPLTHGHTKGQTQLGEMRGTFHIPHLYRTQGQKQCICPSSRTVTCTMPPTGREKLNSHTLALTFIHPTRPVCSISTATPWNTSPVI